ncbi:MAG: stage II sporulation protein M [Gammaproteobacteria bacterium]|nr:stage II sporulation protein M [Gammaproteobacteria bacterium]
MQRKPWTLGVVAATLIWATAASAGVAVAAQHTSALAAAEEPGEGLERVVRPTGQETPPAQLCIGILGRNLAVYLWLLLGLVSGGLTTVALLTFNGVALGQVAGFALGAGMPIGDLALLTLPHAIPEVAAFLLAGAVGLRGPTLLSAWFKGTFSRALLTGVSGPVAGGALVIAAAAVIEVFVTVPIARAGVGS